MSEHLYQDTTSASSSPARGVRAFAIRESALSPTCRELLVIGELDLAVVDQLQARLDASAAEGLDVLIRLDECEFIDSAGIAVIVFTQQRLADEGRRLAVCGSSPAVKRIFSVVGLDEAEFVYPSAEAAMADGSTYGGGVLPTA